MTKLREFPIEGKYGKYGGKYIPETLVPAINELEAAYEKIRNDSEFKKELDYYLQNYAGRPTPLFFAKNLTDYVGGARIFLKIVELLQRGDHKTNNYFSPCLL